MMNAIPKRKPIEELYPMQGFMMEEKPIMIIINMKLFEFKTDEVRVHFTHWLEAVLDTGCRVEIKK